MLYGTLRTLYEHSILRLKQKLVGKKIYPHPMQYENYEIICVKQCVYPRHTIFFLVGVGVGGAINRGF
jgi:hypothetical protein